MPDHLPRFLRRYWLAFAIVAAFILLWAALWSVRITRVGIITAFVTPDLFLDAPVSPLKLVGEEPLREEVWLDVPQGRGELVADVYRPKDGDRHGAMLISVGAAPHIRDHPGVVRLSKAVARAGMVVMIPQLYYPFEENVLPEDVQGLVDAFGTNIQEIVASFQWLRQQPYVDEGRAGIFGASAGGGIALVAAADPRIRDQVAYMASLGTYFDMVDLINAITTESIHYNGRQEPWDPWLKSVRVLYRSIISYLPQARDRDILTRVFVDEDASARDDLPDLSPLGRQIYDAFRARDSDRILAFWGEFSPQDVATLRDISPSSYVANLHTDLFVITDRSDPFIPYVESRRLRDAASQNGDRIHYAEFDFLNHVELSSPRNPFSFLADLIKLIYYAWLLMLQVL
ncbi:MAG TPA: prolyl oligopeptidase family serine peptidase [Dehalococcoidia bacterium]|nr:prolyl oligopeptidase family serine peptidase [Dehalococcoidia bacterium]